MKICSNPLSLFSCVGKALSFVFSHFHPFLKCSDCYTCFTLFYTPIRLTSIIIFVLHTFCTSPFPRRRFNPIQARLFLSSCGRGRGHIVPPIENHVLLVLTAYYQIFLKVCSKLDHMTHFCFDGNGFMC